jgi:hypothetical protein
VNLAIGTSYIIGLLKRKILNPIFNILSSSENHNYGIPRWLVACIGDNICQLIINMCNISQSWNLRTKLTRPIFYHLRVAMSYNAILVKLY